MELITSNENEEEQQEKKADKGEVAKQEPANGSLKPEPDSPKDSSGKKEMDEEDADGEEGDDDDADDDDDSGLSDIEVLLESLLSFDNTPLWHLHIIIVIMSSDTHSKRL